jgi:signal transduction histidine kinase/ligand-binding sensor domain-containing protein/DNA-binding response OmpR family regulator
MIFFNRLVALLLLYLAIVTSAEAQITQYRFSQLSNSNGLSNNQVTCILKDSKGFMWFGTAAGLNRFDGYTFKVYRYDVHDTTSLIDNYIFRIFEDNKRNLWISTRSGICIYNPHTESFDRNIKTYLAALSIPEQNIAGLHKDSRGNYWIYGNMKGLYRFDPISNKTICIKPNTTDKQSIISSRIVDIASDSKGFIWTLTSKGALEKIDPRSLKVVLRDTSIQRNNRNSITYRNIYIDNDDDLWINFFYEDDGVFCYKPTLRKMIHYTKNSPDLHLSSNLVSSILQDKKGVIWIGTDHGGITLFNKKTGQVNYIINNPDDNKSLAQNSVYCLYKDNNNVIWTGTYKKGICYYHEDLVRFHLYKHNPLDPYSINLDDVNCFAEDANNNMYIGTNGGGLNYYNRATGTFKAFTNNPASNSSLSTNVIVSLKYDSKKLLWIGTYAGGLDCFDGQTFTHYKHDPNNPNSISENSIWKIFEDSRGNLWIGTLGGGLELFDRQTNSFKHYNASQQNSVQSNFVVSIAEDKDGNLWFGTDHGIDKLDIHTKRFSHWNAKSGSDNSLSNSNINVIYADSRNRIWIGTREGLNLYDIKSNTFKVFRMENGLPDNIINSIVEDNSGNLWIGTPGGLVNLSINSHMTGDMRYSFKVYDAYDGLQGKDFNLSAAFKNRAGELWFGGSSGFNVFNPNTFKVNQSAPDVVFTDLQIFNQPVSVNKVINGRVILEKSIVENPTIVLKYSENVFSISFAALNTLHPEKSKYLYTLEGFNEGWLSADSKVRKATFTNLSPGKYTFRVKATNSDGFWNEKGSSITIIVRPPFWLTWYAYLCYVLLIGGILYYMRSQVIARARLRYEAERQRHETERVQELDMLKTRFFTNVSHEFRTPLTLIITPIENMINSGTDTQQLKQLSLILRNAKRLLSLVNQLLDFRKLEVQQIKLNPVLGELVQFIKDISYSFSDISEKRSIYFDFISNIPELYTLFDTDKMEKILYNLLSNAYKFTPNQGRITVEIEAKAQTVLIHVRDTGIGIPEENLDKIFENFFQIQVPSSMVNQGSGIGLSLVKEFVKMHNGNISVSSQTNVGSCFTVELPITQKAETEQLPYPHNEQIAVAINDSDEDINAEINVNADNKPHTGKATILIVEDNDDFRFYLSDNLKSRYKIAEAVNGKEAIKIAFNIMPDLIVSDVMMPEMDGISLCHKLKTDPRTSHIPIILLTARSTDEQKLEGLSTGADDYLTKPFNFELLEARIKNLISQRKALRNQFNKQLEVEPSDIQIVSLDEKLIQKSIEIVEKNIANPDFSVEELSREIGMSRVHLYKKLLSLTGKTPIEFIRVLRLKRAAQLLEKSQLSVAEVAYKVGFNNPKYFARYFKTEFNVYPSEYNGQKKQDPNLE